MYSGLAASEDQLEKIALATEANPVLSGVMHNLAFGWEKGSANAYYTFRKELSVVNGILLRIDKIVIPTELRNEMLQRLHEGHLGAEKITAMARNSLFGHNMSSDIDRMTSECSICQSFRYQQQKESLKLT